MLPLPFPWLQTTFVVVLRGEKVAEGRFTTTDSAKLRKRLGDFRFRKFVRARRRDVSRAGRAFWRWRERHEHSARPLPKFHHSTTTLSTRLRTTRTMCGCCARAVCLPCTCLVGLLTAVYDVAVIIFCCPCRVCCGCPETSSGN